MIPYALKINKHIFIIIYSFFLLISFTFIMNENLVSAQLDDYDLQEDIYYENSTFYINGIEK